MTLLSVMIWELWSFKFEVFVQSGILEQFWLCPVLFNLTMESVNMVQIKVVDNFFIFPTVYGLYPFEFWNSRYDRFSELLMLDVTQKIPDFVNSCNCHVGHY